MKTIQLLVKSLAFAVIAIISTSIDANNLYIKNDSSWDIAIKFATPENTRAVETRIPAGLSEPVGKVEDMYDIVNLSVRRSGWGSSVMSGFTALNTKMLRQESQNILNQAGISNYTRDIYWIITPTYTGWTAKAGSVQRAR